MSEFTWISGRSADGLSLMARDYPATVDPRGLPVVCLHGLTRNSRDFEDVAPWIAAQGRRVIVPDVRGRGRSQRAPDPATYQPAAYAADVAAMLDAAGEERAVVVGTSMGGLIAMAMAVVAPQRLAAAVLNDVGPVLRPEGLARIASYAGQASAVSDWTGAAAYAQATNRAAFPDYGDEEWAAFARRIFRDGPQGPELDYDPQIMKPMREAAASGAPAPDLWPLFEALTRNRPVLLVRGERSDLVGPAEAEAMRARAPQMDYAEVPRVGHAPMLTEPAAQAALAAFLDRVD